MPTIFATDAIDHACPYNEFKPCLAQVCMAWVWKGPIADRCETDNIVDTPDGPRPVGTPPTPEGEGWEMDGPTHSKGYQQSVKLKLPKATAQRWIKQRPRAQGYCGRARAEDRDDYGW